MLKKILITCGIIALLLAGYAAAGFYWLPKWVKANAPELVAEQTGALLGLQDMHLDPFEWKADVQGIEFNAADGAHLLSLEQITLDINVMQSIRQKALVIDFVELQRPKVDLERRSEQRFNFSDLLDKLSSAPSEPEAASETSSDIAILIHKIDIKDGEINWRDLTIGEQAKESLIPVNFSITDVSTLPNSKAQFNLSFSLASGGALEWQGDVDVMALSSQGEIKLEKLVVSKVWELFLRDIMSLQIDDGFLSMHAKYAFSQDEKNGLKLLVSDSDLDIAKLALSEDGTAAPLIALESASLKGIGLDMQGQAIKINATGFDVAKIELAGNGEVAASIALESTSLHDIKVDMQNEAIDIAVSALDFSTLKLAENAKPEPLVVLGDVSIRGVKLDLQKQAVDIAAINTSDGRIKSWLDANGQINYQRLFPVAEAGAVEDAAGDSASKPWQIALAELAIKNYQIDFTDNTQTKPVSMRLSELNVGLKNFRNTDGEHLPVNLTGRFNNSGSLNLSGDMVLTPFSADWQVGLKDIKLKTFQSYIDPFLSLELVDGGFNTQGQLQFTVTEKLQLTYQGEANVDNLITRDKDKNKDFLKWANLEVKGMQLDVSKQNYHLGKVVFDRPYFRFTIKKDRSNNVTDILVPQTTEKSAKKAGEKNKKPMAKEPEPVVSISEITMKQGQSDFADYSLILPFIVKMNALNGEVDGFASNTDKAAKLKLDGRVQDLATVKIDGNYQMQSGDSNIKLSFSHMPLPLVTPYMAEFVGYKIEKGQMALELAYSITKGQLDAQNKIFIDQLVLGEKVENPNAVSLPLELGVALLKDADGKINLDFPITGSLEDPEFSVSSMVADVLVNLITKAVTSPFKAMGSLFDANEDFSNIAFTAGSGDLSSNEMGKLDKIAKALASKPELVLEVKGVAYEVQDWPVMRFDALTDILKKMKSGELRDKGETIRSEYIDLSDDEFKRLLAKFYAEVFPQKIDYSLFGAPRIKSKPDVDFYQVAREELEAKMLPDPERLNELAMSRASHIAKYLTEKAGIARNRIYVLATELRKEDKENGIHAILSLNVAS